MHWGSRQTGKSSLLRAGLTRKRDSEARRPRGVGIRAVGIL
jgi:predicted AAA+ superfamily ATPase